MYQNFFIWHFSLRTIWICMYCILWWEWMCLHHFKIYRYQTRNKKSQHWFVNCADQTLLWQGWFPYCKLDILYTLVWNSVSFRSDHIEFQTYLFWTDLTPIVCFWTDSGMVRKFWSKPKNSDWYRPPQFFFPQPFRGKFNSNFFWVLGEKNHLIGQYKYLLKKTQKLLSPLRSNLIELIWNSIWVF